MVIQVGMLERKMLRDLRRMGAQAVTIALVIASAVAGFVACLSAVDALERSRERFYREARFGDVFVDLVRAPLSLVPKVMAIPGIAQAQPMVTRLARISLPDRSDPLAARLISLDDTMRAGQAMNQVVLRQGRWPSTRSLEGDLLEALVSEGFAQAQHLRPGDIVQALVQGRERRLRITGIAISPDTIFAGMGGAPDPRGFGIFWIDARSLAAICELNGAFNHLVVRLAPDASQAAVLDGLQRLLRTSGARLAYGREHQPSHAMLDSEIREQRVIGTVLPSIFAAVAAFLLHTVMSRQVGTQREQIAALKALGFTGQRIAGHYLQGVTLIALLGSAMGLGVGSLLGAGLAGLYAEFFHFPALEHRLPGSLAVAAVALACAVAATGALHAVRQGTRVPPALAMQAQAPGRFRHLWIERLGAGRIRPGLGMVVRNMVRRPWRSSLSIIGVAAAFSLVVLGNFVRDAIETIEVLGFERSLRADLMIWTLEPRDAMVQRELLRLPGVRQVEPWREVAVRLVHGSATERVRLQGGPSEPALKRVIDIDGAVHAVPSAGLLLSDRLAQRLHAQVGDSLVIEVVEGSMPVIRAPIAAVVRDSMGLNAWILRTPLNRMLGEGDLASAHALWVEPGSAAGVIAILQRTPGVAGLFSKATLQANMREVSSRNVRIMSTVMTAFAMVIAVGVVYNQARVLLAERSHELASLRVLGLTRAEVSALLLGEVGLGLLIALHLGVGLGTALVHAVAGLLATDQFLFPVTIRARTHLLAAVTVVLTTIATAAVVRRRIDRLDLVSVLKTRE